MSGNPKGTPAGTPAGGSNDESRLIDHNYDGIQEFDNPLPRWWVYLFYATIVFAVLYYVNVPGVGVGKGRIADYDADVAAAKARYATIAPSSGPTLEQLTALAGDRNVVASGKTLFGGNCSACHKPDGGGMIGPNLTDDYWIHGGTIADIRRTINEGVLVKGMPQWGKVLTPDQVNAVAAYVTTLRGSHPPNGKAPEGTQVQP